MAGYAPGHVEPGVVEELLRSPKGHAYGLKHAGGWRSSCDRAGSSRNSACKNRRCLTPISCSWMENRRRSASALLAPPPGYVWPADTIVPCPIQASRFLVPEPSGSGTDLGTSALAARMLG